jgi:hypothetical protein
MKYLFISLMALCLAFFCSDLKAEPLYGITSIEYSRRDLFYIIALNKNLVGQVFNASSDEEQRYFYEQIGTVPEYAKLFPAKTFDAFKRSMNLAAKIVPKGAGAASKTDETLITDAYYLKRLARDMGIDVKNIKDSLSLIPTSVVKRDVDHIRQTALGLCDGSFLTKNEGLKFIIRKYQHVFSFVNTGKSCEDVINRDVMDLIEPYRDIDSSNNIVFTTSLYLVKKLFPDGKFVSSNMFAAIKQVKNIKKLDPKLNVLNALGREVGFLSNLELVRLIQLADTNYGTSFFSINAIIDLSASADAAVKNVTAFREAHLKLYVLFEDHLQERRKRSDVSYVETLTRPYHFWAGTFITCELMERGYRPEIAQAMSAGLGVAYEARTMGIASLKQVYQDVKNDLSRRNFSLPTVRGAHYNSIDDSLQQIEGAEYGVQICSGL